MQTIMFAAGLVAAAPAPAPPSAPPPPVCPPDAVFCFAGPPAEQPPGRTYTASIVGYVPTGAGEGFLVRLGYGELTYSDEAPQTAATVRDEPHRFGDVRDLVLSFVRRF